MNQRLKNNKGITLIALIITIIILIILAGISISILTGQDGLINKVKQGTQNYQNAAIEEQERLNTIYDGVGTGIASNTGTIYDVSEKQRKIDELQAELDALKADLGDKAATPNKMLKDYQAYVNGELVTGMIESKSEQTYTPGTTNQTIAAGQYLSGDQTILGDADLKAENIKNGVEIFGITGTLTDKHIETGYVDITYSHSSWLYKTINFSRSYTSTPVVYYKYGAGQTGGCVYLHETSVSSFKLGYILDCSW